MHLFDTIGRISGGRLSLPSRGVVGADPVRPIRDPYAFTPGFCD